MNNWRWKGKSKTGRKLWSCLFPRLYVKHRVRKQGDETRTWQGRRQRLYWKNNGDWDCVDWKTVGQKSKIEVRQRQGKNVNKKFTISPGIGEIFIGKKKFKNKKFISSISLWTWHFLTEVRLTEPVQVTVLHEWWTLSILKSRTWRKEGSGMTLFL